MITIRIAGIPIGLDNRYPNVLTIAQDYLTDDPPEFTVAVSADEIARQRSEFTDAEFSDGYCESIALYRHIAERMPSYDGFVFHGCVMECDGKAYAFTAQSGTGKTTHARNWLRAFGDRVHILNGDKPILRVIDGTIYACGTPWRGKENYGVNEMRPLAGIAFLERGAENRAQTITPGDATVMFMRQLYLPTKDPLALAKTMRIADKVLRGVPLIRLACNMDVESAVVSFTALTNKKPLNGETEK